MLHDTLDTSGEPRLLGARCAACGTLVFPARQACERCGDVQMLIEPLPVEGRLWSWTSQEFPPPSPPYFRRHGRSDFAPYHVGYVDLGDVIVLARLSVTGPNALRIGATMRLALEPLPSADDSVPPLVPVFVVQKGDAP